MNIKKRPLTIAQTVAEQLREQILSREIKAGEPLRQESIATAFGTSIIPVREALRQLASEGLVELLAHKGAVATELTLDRALEWIHLRRIIEADLIGQAIEKMTDHHIDEAEKILNDFNQVLTNREDVASWSQGNWKFHAALYAPANRPETMKILEALHHKSDRYVKVQLISGNHIDRAQEEHLEMIDLCRKRRKRALKSLLDRHIIEVEEDLIDTLQN